MSDVDVFAPISAVTLPDMPVYLVHDIDRGDAMANWSPDEALPAIAGAGRTPLTLNEGLHWLLQRPETLQRGRCFMTIGSRRRKPEGSLDARTPALWISNGTGRDGAANRNAPKVGWCWAGNRHTWLGIRVGRAPQSVTRVGPFGHRGRRRRMAAPSPAMRPARTRTPRGRSAVSRTWTRRSRREQPGPSVSARSDPWRPR